ncbi:RraA family protein [Terriglobus roseus]|uniref:Putative 4-hydroxy-4-methyl-2-oxoglutarate aldolase n=1 Tax=Terriglobus roseus TaxID=392734 RepID=A0A1H4IY92_9BACT|nr:RraA family protein [Terriglobus roseus]SEB39023.1 Regulator of RNase E activity RraA [Terriglobus roseus]
MALHRRIIVGTVVLSLTACAAVCTRTVVMAQTPKTAADYEKDLPGMLEAYRHVEAASVSDAIEQTLHEKHYMSHKMQAIFPTKFVGTALTVLLKKEENHDPDALGGMLKAIDTGGAGSVYVMKIEDGADIAGMGGLMGTAMWSRGFTGAVVDGGVRDLPQLKRIGFPVYATGPVPSTSVGHYRFGGMNLPVDCDGVTVNAGDIISADQDGVVVIPRARAAEVLVAAQKLDETEHAMYPYIERLHSIVAAVKQFGRI